MGLDVHQLVCYFLIQISSRWLIWIRNRARVWNIDSPRIGEILLELTERKEVFVVNNQHVARISSNRELRSFEYKKYIFHIDISTYLFCSLRFVPAISPLLLRIVSFPLSFSPR